jgi:uncharacterized membrane protein
VGNEISFPGVQGTAMSNAESPDAERIGGSASPRAGRVTRGQIILLAIILLVGGLLRFNRIADTSLWMDEIWSVELAMGRGSVHDQLPSCVVQHEQIDLTDLASAPGWWNIWPRLGGITHPPLYFVVLRLWIDLFGTSATAIRSMSAIFSLGGILLLFDICRLLHGPRVALFAAAIMTLSIAQLDLGQEARSYPMLMFLALGCTDAVVRIQFFGATAVRLATLAIFFCATALTHYFAAGTLLALAVYAMIVLQGRDRRAAAGAFIAGTVLIAALWGPWFFSQLRSIPRDSPSFLSFGSSPLMLYSLEKMASLPVQFLQGDLGDITHVWADMILVALILVVPLIRISRRRDQLLWLLWLFGTIGFVVAAGLAEHAAFVHFLRYTILASPAVYALLAGVDWPKWKAFRVLVPVSTLVILVALVLSRLGNPLVAKQDWRQLAGVIDSNAGPDDLLVFYNESPWVSPGTWYMGFRYYAPDSQRPWAVLDRPADQAFLDQIKDRNTIWLMGRAPHIDGPRVLPGWKPMAARSTSAGEVCIMQRQPGG